MKRHLAKLRNTDQRVIVLFMQIPDREDHALVAPVENIPDAVEQALMVLVESQEAQADPILANVLGRRMLGNSGRSALQYLHDAQMLRAVHIDQVIMYPEPNMPFPLRQILEGMGRTTLPPASTEVLADNDAKFNPHTNNVAARSIEERKAIAMNLIIAANDLQSEANRKIEEAYRIAPELSPATKPRAPAPIEASDIAEAVIVPPVKRVRGKRKSADPAAGPSADQASE